MNIINPAHDPQDVTRTLFQDFSTWMTVSFYVVAITAIAVFAYGVWMQIAKYRRGAPDRGWKMLGHRFMTMLKEVFSQRTVRRRDKPAGHAHALIFFGFVLLFIGTSIITLDYDITGPLLGLNFWHGSFYLWFSLVLDFAGLALIAGLLFMMYRRGWLRPPKLDYARPDRNPDEPDYNRSQYRIEDWAFLWTLVIIALTGFVLAAARMVWLHADPLVWDYRWWSPVATVLAYAFKGVGLTADGGEILRLYTWWFHGILALAFIAVIPYTKAMHMLTAAGSLMFRDPLAAQRLPTVPEEAVQVGYEKVTDFSWKHLLNLDACTKCGRCHEACPAATVGLPLSPRDLVLSLREFANESQWPKLLGGDPSKQVVHGDGVNQIRPETLWACRTCMACVEICPVGIEHVPMIVQMRRHLVEEGEMDPLLQGTLQNIQKKGNSFGENKRKRARWAKDLDFEIKDARKEPVDMLWFVGDYASFDPRNQKVSQRFARILTEAGVDFGILHDGEQNAGNDVRRVGEEGLYEMLAENNIEALNGASFQSIITTDPHSYNTIRNEYPDFGARFAIEHYSSLLDRLIAQGRLSFPKTLNYRVTYHDPCHLGRFNRGFDAPRNIIRALGLDLVEMQRSGDNSFCCGAGGGRIWQADPVGVEKPSENRMHEAAQIEGLEVFVVACPKDVTMFEDALKTAGYEGRFVVKELIELVYEALGHEKREREAADVA